MPNAGDERNDILLNDAVKRALADGKCPACERGEKTIKPEPGGVLRSMTVHYPSGNICMASPEWKEMQETIRVCKAQPAE